MLRFILGLYLTLGFSSTAFANSTAEKSLLSLCDAFGETNAECQCYMDEVKQVYPLADIDLAAE